MAKWLVAGMVCLICVAHVFLWRSDMPPELKMTFTMLNALGWSVVLVPILFVDRWLDAMRRRNRDDSRP